MRERRGNLALIEGPVVIVHGVNGGWHHGPKFGAGFAASLAERGPMARASYMAIDQSASSRAYYATMMSPWMVPADERAAGLPLGWAFPRRIEGGVWLVHGVTQRSVKGTKEKKRDGKEFVRRKPADIGAIAAVLESAVVFVRKKAGVRMNAGLEPAALPLHMPRIGCGLGGLVWDDVRAVVERVEQRANVPLANASEDYRALCSRWPIEFNVWTKGA